MYEDSIRSEFTHQTESFARNRIATAAETLGVLVDLVPADAEASWLEVACGPAAIARALAAKVGRVTGIDLTPAMVEKACEEAGRVGIGNAEFSVGDATALEFADGSFDGAVTRFSLHHIPAPQRVLEEMARVVRSGGRVIVSDLLTDEDADAQAWHQEIERLRDPSHWATPSPSRLRAMGEAAGLELESEQLIPIEIDYEDWLERGSGGEAAAVLIDRLLTEAPVGAESFQVSGEPGSRRLRFRTMLLRWRRP
ncbi:MAG TPA: methyltransferase domain-containing protein [Solirubrobacterales bacterium]|nr:methyltransferase domain-containing protein [Solirubrobacterales bacterium]